MIVYIVQICAMVEYPTIDTVVN